MIRLDFKNIPDSILRIFKMTINPNAFNLKKLNIKTHNGGNDFENFQIKEDFNHGASIENVSNFTSSNTSFGLTNERIAVGDNKKTLVFNIDKSLSALVAMLEFTKLKKNIFKAIFFCI